MTPQSPWLQMLAIAAGGIVGCLGRWAVGLWLNPRWSGFPLGTLVVNCVGGVLIGAAFAWFQRSPNELLRLLVVTGFLGGLTTFSSFSGESLLLLQRGQFVLAMAHTALHVFGALGCAAVGYGVVQRLA